MLNRLRNYLHQIKKPSMIYKKYFNKNFSSDKFSKLQLLSGGLFFTGCSSVILYEYIYYEYYSIADFVSFIMTSAGFSFIYGIFFPVTVPMTFLFALMEITRK